MNTNAVSFLMPAATPEPPKPKNAKEAATQFEALLLTQLLRTARSEEEREDSSMDTMWDMAAQQFARVMADAGGLGLAQMIQDNLQTPDESQGPRNRPPGTSGKAGNPPTQAEAPLPNAAPFPTRPH